MSDLFFDDEDILDAVPEEDGSKGRGGASPSDKKQALTEPLTPRTTPDLFGHEDVEARLLADFNAGRMPHAIVLSGPAGIGKATLAYRLARFLLAQGDSAHTDSLFGPPPVPETLAVSPDHSVFSRVASGGHADLWVIERGFDDKKGKLRKNISAEDARGIAPFLRKTASEGGWRVVIVDGAEDLNTASQNALLKILEEPPPRALLILTTTHPGAFLPTIRSRCRMVPLKPLADEVVEKILTTTNPSLSLQEKALLLRIGAGSIGRAQEFLANDGIAVYKTLLGMAQGLPDLDMVVVHDFADKFGRGNEAAFSLFCDILGGWCEHLVRCHAREQIASDIFPGDSAIFSAWQSVLGPAHFLQAGDKLRQLFDAVERFNLDKRQAMISAFMLLRDPEYQALVA